MSSLPPGHSITSGGGATRHYGVLSRPESRLVRLKKNSTSSSVIALPFQSSPDHSSLSTLILGEALALSGSFFGQGRGVIWATSVACRGSESGLLGCPHAENSNRNTDFRTCTHERDASVVCSGKTWSREGGEGGVAHVIAAEDLFLKP